MTTALQTEFITVEEHRRIIEAVCQDYRFEIGKLGVKVATYAQALEDAGIEAPDPDGPELVALWRQAADTVSAATALVEMLGTGKELIFPMRRGNPR